MPDQVDYYNEFGKAHRDSILNCPEPYYWTTDFFAKGRVYKEIKQRVDFQNSLFTTYFSAVHPVLDIGCGFGRQSVLLAKKGFQVTGIDTSEIFIEIARDLFNKHQLRGKFDVSDINSIDTSVTFKQVIVLDVLEHIVVSQRKSFVKKLFEITDPGAVIIISLPHVKDRFSSRFNNRVRRKITQYIPFFKNKEEHPFPIPEPQDIKTHPGAIQYNNILKFC